MKIKVKALSKNYTLPNKTYNKDAGIDLYANEPAFFNPGDKAMIGTGISMAIPDGYYGQIFDRSSMAVKKELHCLAGVIDCTYRGEIKIVLSNIGKEVRHVNSGDKIAQMVILPVPDIEIEEVNELDDTERGIGGIGSTGK